MNHKHDPPTEVVLHSCSGSRYTVADVERVLESDEVVSERSKAVDATPATGDSPTERLLARLNNVRPNANGWMASCPAHDDRNPSLTIAEGEDGRCLINCFAGCSPDAIVAAVGLRMADLYRRDDEPDESPSVSGQLVAIAIKAGIRPFHDSAHVAYAWVPVGGHQEAWALKSRRFERWLRFELYRQSKLTPGADAVKAAVEMLSARADFDAPEDEVELRSAWCDLGLAYDLADSDSRAVIVTPTGWSVRTQSQVPFVRRDSVLALPVPAEKGDIELLRHYVNVASNEEFVLLVAWLVMALRPNGPYPVLVIVGPQGSAKSTQTRMHKQLVDPVKAPLRSLPGSLRDLAIAARSSHVLAFDNVSKLTDVMSDGFCRLATGDGFATRELYSDDEEVIFEHTRALILNGIDAIVTRQDLLGRAIVVRLAPIPDTNRLDEDTLWSRFDQDRARIFGGLLDGAVSALANWDSTPAAGFRMADFARWSAAAMPAFGWGPDEFYRAYRENLSGALKASLEGSILATVVMRLLDQPATPAIDGTPAAVWRQLSAKLSDEERQSGGFPKNAQAMSAQLTRLSPALGEVGVSVENTTRGSGDSKERRIVIRRLKDSGTHGTQPQHSTSNAE